MKTTLRLAVALAALAVATTASAQQRPMIGIGASVNPEADFSPTVEVYVPIRITPSFRLEPSLGIFSQDVDGGGGSSNLTFGIGAFFVKEIAAPADMYAGGRLKVNFASEDNGVTDESGTDFVLAGAVGGEYYLAPQFSIGLEAQLGLYDRGDVSGNDSGFFTTGLGFLRFYF